MLIDHAPRADQRPLPVRPYQVWYGKDRAVAAEFFRLDTGYLVRFPGVGDFTVDPSGLHVLCQAVPDIAPAAIEHVLENQIRPLALGHQGNAVFHGSVVELDESAAIAFLGVSGRGKSTLAAAFAAGGHPFLADDVLLLESDGIGYRALPQAPSLRLWPDSCGALLPQGYRGATPLELSPKLAIAAHPPVPFCPAPRRLMAVYLLGEKSDAELAITRMGQAETVLGWISNAFVLETVQAESLKTQFDRACDLAGSVPMFRLDYPRHYETLDAVRERILHHARADTGRPGL